MKKIGLIGLMAIGMAATAQNVAVKFWAEEPTNALERVHGVPLAWPSAVRELGASTNAPAGWSVWTRAQLQTHMAARRGAFDAWRQKYEADRHAEREVERTQAEARVRALREEREAIEAWLAANTNVTAGNVSVVVSNLARLHQLGNAERGARDASVATPQGLRAQQTLNIQRSTSNVQPAKPQRAKRPTRKAH